MDIHLPGIVRAILSSACQNTMDYTDSRWHEQYVNRIVPATVEKGMEFINTTPYPSASGTPVEDSTVAGLSGDKLAAHLRRVKIAKRTAKELKAGYYCNLGVRYFSALSTAFT